MPHGLFPVLRREDERIMFLMLLPQIFRAEFVHRLQGASPCTFFERGRKRQKHQERHKLQDLNASFSMPNIANVSGNLCFKHAGEAIASTVEDSPCRLTCVAECIFHVPQGGPSNVNENDEAVSDTPFLPDLCLRCLAYLPITQHGSLAMLSRTHRDLVRASALLRRRQEHHITDQWICIFAGFDRGWTAFDPSQNRWRSLAPANVTELFLQSDKESLAAGNHLLWLGKEAFDFACYRYDLVFNRWERGPQMVTNRSLFGSATFGEFAFVAGGFSAGGMQYNVLNSAEKYNSYTGIWEPIPPMSTARQKCAGFFMDGKFYVIGGKTRDHEQITSGEEYNPERRVWRTIENMYPAQVATPYSSPPLVAVAGNQLYAIESSNNLLKSYDKQANTWTVLGPVPVRADDFNGWGLAFKGLGDKLFVIGRYHGGEGVAVYSWQPQAGGAAPVWELINLRAQGTGNFLYNCAVMTC